MFTYLSYKVAGAKIDNQVYDPFEILGLRSVSSSTCCLSSRSVIFALYRENLERRLIVSQYLPISRVLQKKKSNLTTRSFHACCTYPSHPNSHLLYSTSIPSHPDKVKPSGNETIESIANHFVDLTKAYKSFVPFPTESHIMNQLIHYLQPH